MLSPETVKEFLDVEGIEYDDSDSTRYLMAIARRRLKRKERQAETDADPLGRIWGVADALSLAELKDKMLEMSDNVLTDKVFVRAKYIIDDVSWPCVVMRHSSDLNGCRGKVEGGSCMKCGAITNGVACYSFELLLVDIDMPEITLTVQCAQGAASCMFPGISATDFMYLTEEVKGDKIEKWCGLPVISGMVMTLETGADKVRVHPFRMRLLPKSHVKDDDEA